MTISPTFDTLLVNGNISGSVTATGSSVAQSLADRFNEIVSAIDYGVVADGTTDDASHLLAACAASVGKILLLPSGTILVNSAINITTQIHIRGNGAATTTIKRGNALTGPMLKLTADNSILEDFSVDGNGVVNTVNTNAQVLLQANKCIARNLTVTNFRGPGISLAGDYCCAESNIIIGIGDATIQSYGIWGVNTKTGLQAINNTVLNNGLNGIFLDGPGIRIVGNYLAGNHWQVSPQGGGQIAVDNSAGQTNGAVVANNTIRSGGGTATYGIELNGDNLTVTANTIEFQGKHGINLNTLSGPGTIVSSNVIRNNGASGIFMGSGVGDIQIIGNLLIDDQAIPTQEYGVHSGGGTPNNVVIVGNTFRGNTIAAILLTQGTGCVTRSNSGATDDPTPVGNTFTVGDGTAATTLYNNGLVATERAIFYQTTGVNRWKVMADSSAESGSNNGSDFAIIGYNDAGTVNSNNSIRCVRSTGIVRMPLGAVITGGSSTIDGAIIGGTTPAAATVTALTVNTSGPTVRSGTGAASGTQPKGSLWLRTDGGVGTTLYVSQGAGTWNAVAGV